MKRSVLAGIALVGLLSGGFLLLEEIDARGLPNEVVEKQVSDNLMRVRIHGKWEDVPLMPLAEHACHTGGDLQMDRYCE